MKSWNYKIHCDFWSLVCCLTSRYLKVVVSAGTTPFFPPASITMLHSVILSSIFQKERPSIKGTLVTTKLKPKSNVTTEGVRGTYRQTLNSRANKLHCFISCTSHRNFTNNLLNSSNIKLKALQLYIMITNNFFFSAYLQYIAYTYLQNQIFSKQIIGHFTIHHKFQGWGHLYRVDEKKNST